MMREPPAEPIMKLVAGISLGLEGGDWDGDGDVLESAVGSVDYCWGDGAEGAFPGADVVGWGGDVAKRVGGTESC